MANFKLKHGTQKHTDIREAIRARVKAAERAVSNKTTDYADDEDRAQIYIKTTEADAVRETKKSSGDPQYVNLEVPYSFAMLMSWHTYISSVFLSRTPIMQFSGRHGETENQIQAVEAIQDYQTMTGGHLAPYYIWFLDAGKYGVGVIGNYWDEEISQISEIVEEQVSYLGISIAGKTRKVRKTRRVKTYEGNRVFNIRPQDFIFDSRVSLSNFQQGEFAGRYCDLSWNTIIARAEYEQYYNLDELRKVKGKKQGTATAYRDTGSSQLELPDAISRKDTYFEDNIETPRFSELVEMTIRLVPKDWGLGDSKYPELWVFTLADDEVIIESQPFNSLHSKFPYSILEYEIEGYGLQKRSMMEMLEPLNDTMGWLLNTHFFNTRASLNGQFVYDPSRLTVKDFKSKGGGRMIRMKPTAYGQDVRSMIYELPVTDVTQGHLRDMSIISDLMQRLGGVTDNIMGQVNAGGRKSATEVRQSNTFGANRLKTQAEYFSASGFAPHAQMMVQNTQQFYDAEMKFKIAGDLMEDGEQFLQVDPEMIAGFYDFAPVDGTLPVDRFAQVTMWTQMLQQLRATPEVYQQYDMGRIFAWVAQLGGLKNIKRFKINVVPDASLEGNNVIPLGGNRGREAIGGTGGNTGNTTGVPGAASPNGLGPAG